MSPIADKSDMGSERRRFKREKRRMSCEFKLDRVYNGIVGDLSARGLFINSRCQPAPGTELEVLLRDVKFGEMLLRCRVARLLKSHRAAAIVIPSGFGVLIENAPEPYYELLVEMGLG